MKKLFYDCETTGLSLNTNDIIQHAGIIEIDDEVMHSFNLKCRPIHPYSNNTAAMKAHGTAIETMMTFENPGLTLKKLVDILYKYESYPGKFHMIGYNAQFDFAFLRKFFVDLKKEALFEHYFDTRILDVMTLALLLQDKGIYPKNSSIKLTDISTFFGLKTEGAHDALFDVTNTKKIYDLLKGQFFNKISKEELLILLQGGPNQEAQERIPEETTTSS